MRAARERGLLLLLIALAFLAGLFRICDYDVWWHVRTGELILDTREVPRTDPFSHLAEGHRWTNHSWLSSVAMALAHRAGGWNGVTLGKCALTAALAALLWRLSRGAGAGAGPAFLAIALALATARFRLFERPHLATFLMLPLVMDALARRCARVDAGPWRADLLLAAAFLLWANLHGAFLIGLALFLPAIVLASVHGIRGGAGAFSPSSRRLLLLLPICFAATLLNPYGIRAHLYPLINERALLAVRNAEWLSPWRLLGQTPLFFAMLLVLVLLGLRHWRSAGAPRLVLLAPLVFLALRSNRSIGEFAVASAVPLALLLNGAWSRAREGLERSSPGSAAPIGAVVLLGSSALLIGLHAAGIVIQNQIYVPGLGINERLFPIGAADYVESSGLRGRMANTPGFGGYLIWRFWPQRQVFADGRLDVYVDVNEELNRTPWERTLEERGLTYAILQTEGTIGRDPLTEAVTHSPAWALLYWDDAAMVWSKRIAEHADVVARDEYRVAGPLRDVTAIPADSVRTALAEYERAAATAPSFHALFGLGVARLRLRDAAGAGEALSRAAALRPEDPNVWSNLAFAGLSAGRPQAALGAARRAVALAPDDGFAQRHLGVALAELQRYAEAADALERALALMPGNRDVEASLRECRRRAREAEGDE